jgi:hypothetical protein
VLFQENITRGEVVQGMPVILMNSDLQNIELQAVSK